MRNNMNPLFVFIVYGIAFLIVSIFLAGSFEKYHISVLVFFLFGILVLYRNLRELEVM